MTLQRNIVKVIVRDTDTNTVRDTSIVRGMVKGIVTSTVSVRDC